MTKFIIKLHGYLGTFFSVLFLMWFCTGLVMMYHSFPFLTPKQHDDNLTGQKPNFASWQMPEADFIGKSFSIQWLGKKRVVFGANDQKARYENGEFVEVSTGKQAVKIARDKTKINAPVEFVKKQEKLDQWLIMPRQAKHLPVYKVFFRDNAKTQVYIACKTGNIVCLTTQKQRFFAYVGAIPHWMYFSFIRHFDGVWRWGVTALAFCGLMMMITGLVTGFVRYKKKPRAKFKRFKNKWYNLHYYLGLFFGLFFTAWIFSGMMSMTPFNWVSSTNLSPKKEQIFRENNGFRTFKWADIDEQTNHLTYKKINCFWLNGLLYGRVLMKHNTPKLCCFNGELKNINALKNEFKTKFPPDVKVFVQHQSDDYYYGDDKLFPVLHLVDKRADYYVSMQNGQITKHSTSNKINRWLYKGLHCWDFSFFQNHSTIWYIVLSSLLLAGSLLSFTAVVMGVKFIKRKVKKHKKKRNG